METRDWVLGVLETVVWYGFFYYLLFAIKQGTTLWQDAAILLGLAYLGTLHLAYYLLHPFAEEPWLQDQYGETNREYREAVSRFVGMRTFEQILGGKQSNSERGNP